MVEKNNTITINQRNKLLESNLFDEEYYLKQVGEPVDDPLEHYLNTGYKKGYNPSVFFDTCCYLRNNVDVAEAGLNPLLHYVLYAMGSGRKVKFDLSLDDYKGFVSTVYEESLFDDEYYRNQFDNEEIEYPLDHYFKTGAKEGYNPSICFDTCCYLRNNVDVAEAGLNPLLHYVLYAMGSGRKVKFDLSLDDYKGFVSTVYEESLFDDEYYRNQFDGEDIKYPLDHYIITGCEEGKNPSYIFNNERYLEYNVDVKKSDMNPLLHFVRYGLESNRKFIFDLTFREFKEFRQEVYNLDLFDENYYKHQYSDIDCDDAFGHYLIKGWKEGKNPSLIFNQEYYVEHNNIKEDVNPFIHFYIKDFNPNTKICEDLTLGVYKNFKEVVYQEGLFDDEYYTSHYSVNTNPLADYLLFGWKESKNPSYLFNTNKYLEYNVDVANADVNPLMHFVRYGLESKRKFNFDLNYSQYTDFKNSVYAEELFDDEYYLFFNPDISKKQTLPHYLTVGYKRGLNPSLNFDTTCFLENSIDISRSGLNPLIFYVTKSLDSKRKVKFNMNLSDYKDSIRFIKDNGLFDDEFYLSQCTTEIFNPLDHYLYHGWKEGKDPSMKFSNREYFKYNQDVEDAGFNPLLHYVQYGVDQNRIISYGLRLPEFEDFEKMVYDEGLFVDEFYLSQCDDSSQIKHPLYHYLYEGSDKGYDPSLLFSTNQYLKNNKIILEKEFNPLVHYWQFGFEENKYVKFYSTLSELKQFREKVYTSGLFDEEYYQKQFSNNIEMDLITHYLTVGYKENKKPSIYFNQENYLKNNLDVYYTYKNPLIHYVLFALNSGRLINHDLSLSNYKLFRNFVYEKGLFDEEYYMSSLNDDETVIDPLEHYLDKGYKEGKNPSWLFNTKKYYELHPEIKNTDTNPLIHYVKEIMDVYKVISDSGLFDEEHYLKQAGYSFYITNDPLMHFITTGSRQGLEPSLNFSINKYNEMYPDVEESGINPLYHYLKRGKRELRDSFMTLNKHMKKFDNRYNINTSLSMLDALENEVSIIIPIYNAYEETKDCITSVLRNTNIPYELILIDDCSSDKRIGELLSSLEGIPNIKIVRNEKNQGFVKNVNLGMKLTQNDVLLLNSDTIVTPHWLSHIVYCAYSSNHIGTVTPYSNASDISIPQLGAKKDFKFLNKSSYQIDKLSFNSNIEAPTGNGFCLFIKRELIDEIGYFDESFGRGYGEETDFTFRAYKEGWLNIRNDSVFVYHRRHASFNEDASNKLKSENKKILTERYPDLYDLWDEFANSDKIKDSVGRINFLFKENKTSERVLYVTSQNKSKVLLGEDYLKIAEEYDCIILALGSKDIKIGEMIDGRFVLYNKWVIDSLWDKNEFTKAYVNTLINLKIDLVYIKYQYNFYNPNNQDFSLFVKMLSKFEIHALYEATTDINELIETIDDKLHPMDSLEELIAKKTMNFDFEKDKLVVYTALTGNYDNLVTPSVINPNFDYICFTDNPELKSDFWTIKLMEESTLDRVRKARRHKILPHEYLKEYDYSLWIDANFDIIGDVEEYINRYAKNRKLMVIKHDKRDDIYDEARECIRLEKDDPEIINKQIERYAKENYPKNNGLIASGIIFRNHSDPEVIKVMEDWFNEVENYSRRDQLSFNYVCWKNNFKYDESKEFYFKNQYFQRLLHTSDDLLKLKYDDKTIDNILKSFEEKTSIIIPIYNAYDETKACIESVIRYTSIDYELLLIDDCSTDERIGKLLSEYEKMDNVRVITNEVNQGFVKNINLGFENTAHDVVILNSDTEVTPKWLQKLKVTSYTKNNIATVTPLSNNAGAFSVPVKDEDNEINENIGILGTSNIIEKMPKRDKVYATTGNGFCMYIRRDAIYDVGFFDQIYGMGYCEENDFCMRLLEKDWLHALDTSTYIYHKHNVSFSSQKEILFEENRKILDEKFPEYRLKLLDLTNSVDLNIIREKISRALDDDNSQFNVKRILYLIHEGNGGTLHTSIELMANLSENIEPYLLTAGKTEIKLYKYSKISNTISSDDNADNEFLQHLKLLAKWDIKSTYTIREPFNREFRRIYFNILHLLKIDLVHIRHLIRHSFDMPYVAHTLGIPVVLSFHDFYYICPSHNLIDDQENYCGGHCSNVNSNTGQCDITGGLNAPILKSFIQTWRSHVSRMFKYCDAFVTTSKSAHDLYCEFYPELQKEDFRIIEHGRDIQTPSEIVVREFKENEPIRILFPGHINVNKGGWLIKKIKECDVDNKLELHYMGNIHPKFNLEDIGIHHGYYKRSEFCKEVNKIKPHFIGLLSIWPETYCHTLTESWGCGIPVLTLDIGALGERVHENGGGFFIENDPQKAYDKIISLSRSPQDYEKAIMEIPNITFKTTKQMAQDYTLLYNQIEERDKNHDNHFNGLQKSKHKIKNFINNIKETL